MTGKSYSIREMKTIVEYLTENKLYSEIRGRKMWMDFANSERTTRTWQSLKETFLKRILPDIHNPYYKLNMEQINSFRSGYDVGERTQNKLEVHTVSDDSNSNGPTQNVTPQSNNGIGIKEENTAGENIKPSKIPSRSRSSADTVIVETCYETAEDIQKDLESPNPDKENGGTKSLRDCITYSEPLTPMLQEVLDDFQSEPENDPEMEIVQSEPTESLENIQKEVLNTNTENEKSNHEENTELEKATETPSVEATEKQVDDNHPNSDEAGEKHQDSTANAEMDSEVVCVDDSPTEDNEVANHEEEQNKENTRDEADQNAEAAAVNNANNMETIEVHDSTENTEVVVPSGGLPNTNSSTDTTLPNNPEALAKRISNETQEDKPTPLEKKVENKVSRKRSNSESLKVIDSKKTKFKTNKMKAASETEDRKTVDSPCKIVGNVEPKVGPSKQNGIAISKDDASSSKVPPNLAPISEKPSTSTANDVSQTILSPESDKGENVNESSEIKNPCLENLSLFEEQFNKSKYNMSESSDVEQKKKNEVTEDKKKPQKEREKEKEVVMLKSHSESVSEDPTPPKKKHRAGVATTKKDRDRALSNVFGFASGTSQSKRRKQLSRRRRTISQQNNVSQNNGGSDSSEWTSESDSDMYVLPPRGRKNRQTRKYLKPQSGRIFSLEEEGGLFVMYGKKIYPLVKDGKLVKNYLHYLPDSDSEEEKNYWKSKYVEEKKKAEQLKKLLEAKEPQAGNSASTSEQANPLRNSTSNVNQPESSNNTGKEICVAGQDEKKEATKAASTAESIKIKFTTKNDQEIHLEGNWPQIHNVLEHVVQIFHKEPQPVSQYKPKTIVEPPSSSGISTPVVITAVHEANIDPEVHEKVNKIESEIFKEIEERDKEEQIQGPSTSGQESNVTKRKAGRPRKSSQSSAPPTPAKRPKISTPQESEVNSTNNKTPDAENKAANQGNKRQRTSRTNVNESPGSSDTKVMQTRRSKLKLDTNDNDEEARYKLPPRNKRQSIKSTTDKNTRDKPQKSTAKAPKIFSSPELTCPNSMESTQGYQDSDPSPMKTGLRKKKLMNFSVFKSRSKSHLRRSTRKKVPPYLYCDSIDSSAEGPIKKVERNNSTCDSIDSSAEGPIKTAERDNSTLNTQVYRSDSYQLLMPKLRTSFRQLEQIDETNLMCNEVSFIKHLDSTAKNEVFSVQMSNNYNTRNSDLISSDIGSSSNISLPVSPELSIVENISFTKESLISFEDGLVIKEEQSSNKTKIPTSCSQFFMSNIDASVPLMQQECGLESCNVNEANQDDPKGLVTESLLSKIGTFNIDDQPNLTDTLDVKLRDLLLESAKKIASENVQKTEDNMDVDVDVEKKAGNKKRCSTPRKRKDIKKSKKALKVQTVIEEEHTESYSKGGRMSCPPVMQPSAREDNLIIDEINITALNINENEKPKGRKKKDVIKVKILRPKKKSLNNTTTKSVKNSVSSLCTDSGINDSESGVFHRINDSVDLIHNHSETCLHANECVGDSLEFVENSKSVLTLCDSTQSGDNMWDSQYEFHDVEDMPPDVFCNNAQDVRSFYKAKQDDGEYTSETVYHSPLGTEVSSLITEDLSDDPQQPVPTNKWYLLSEDETVNTNAATDPSASYGANLKQIFPLTCAVPDLSTITERSRENDDDSRKPTLESVTSDCFNSPSLLNSNF